MTPERRLRTEELYHAALQHEESERSAFLREACAGDEDLCREVESLLAEDQAADSFLERPAIQVAARQLAEEQSRDLLGRRIGIYEIVSLIGAGGMAEVYRARDTRLGRDVAIKVLPKIFAKDAERLARFEAEARALASLNHPNIATIHGLETWEDLNALVLELVPGETLAERISKGPLAVGEAVNICGQVAEALEAAHEKGIVHRDVKPANITVTPEGRVKVLDFGLAQVLGGQQGTAAAESSAGSARTQAGWIQGTLAYISPEQLRGQAPDKRADLWSFGCVLYECLCARKAFGGRTASESINATLAGNPAWERMETAGLPAELERILRRALEKDPEARYQSAGELRADLVRLKRDLEEGAWMPWVRRRTRTALLAAFALSLVAAGGWFLASRPSMSPLRSVPLTSFSGLETQPAFSPAGDQIAFTWNGEKEDNVDIYIKAIHSGQLRRLTNDPAGDWAPTWSPDGRYIAFRRDPAIYIVPASGGAERKVVSDVAAGHSWSPDGESLAISAPADRNDAFSISIFRLSLKSGQKTRLTWPPSGSLDRLPVFAPDGRSVAFLRQSSTGYARDIHVVSQGQVRRLTFDDRDILGFDWTPDGRQIIFSSNRRGVASLWRVAATGGSPESVLAGGNSLQPTVARRVGRLAYVNQWEDFNIWRFELTPAQYEAQSGPRARQPAPPVKLIGSTRNEHSPHFSPDGGRIAFVSDRSGSNEIWVSNSDGSGAVQRTSFGGPHLGTPRWSPDGKEIAFDARPKGNVDVYVVGADDGSPRQITMESSADGMPTWSRDGRWIYFSSDRGGRQRIWKVPAAGGTAIAVTRDAGVELWESPDARAFYYHRRGSADIWRATSDGSEARVAETKGKLVYRRCWALLDRSILFGSLAGANRMALQLLDMSNNKVTQVGTIEIKPLVEGPQCAVAPDGKSFLVSTLDQRVSDIMLVENFR